MGYETRLKENYYSKLKKFNVSLARMESSKYCHGIHKSYKFIPKL